MSQMQMYREVNLRQHFDSHWTLHSRRLSARNSTGRDPSVNRYDAASCRDPQFLNQACLVSVLKMTRTLGDCVRLRGRERGLGSFEASEEKPGQARSRGRKGSEPGGQNEAGQGEEVLHDAREFNG